MAINRTGFEITNTGLNIDKDPAAVLTYTLDWVNWLEGGDTIASAEWTAAARRNDPTPLAIESSGISDGTKTYVELSGGQVDKTYVVAVTVTTSDGLIDRRSFRVNAVSRAA